MYINQVMVDTMPAENPQVLQPGENNRKETAFRGRLFIDVQYSTTGSPDKSNQDATLIRKNVRSPHTSFGVFDGFGLKGEVAAITAEDESNRRLGKIPDSPLIGEVRTAISESIINANTKINDVAHGEYAGIGASAVIGHAFKTGGETFVTLGSVGNTRIYDYSEKGLECLTIDDSVQRAEIKTNPFLQEEFRKLVEETRNSDNPIRTEDDYLRYLQEKFDSITTLDQRAALSDIERRLFNQKHAVTQSLGDPKSPPHIDLRTLPVDTKKRLLITSRGIHKNLSPAKIEEILSTHSDNRLAVEELIKAAKLAAQDPNVIELGGGPGDMTAMIVEVANGLPELSEKEKQLEGVYAGTPIDIRTTQGQWDQGWMIEGYVTKNGEKKVIVIKKIGDDIVRNELTPEQIKLIQHSNSLYERKIVKDSIISIPENDLPAARLKMSDGWKVERYVAPTSIAESGKYIVSKESNGQLLQREVSLLDALKLNPPPLLKGIHEAIDMDSLLLGLRQIDGLPAQDQPIFTDRNELIAIVGKIIMNGEQNLIDALPDVAGLKPKVKELYEKEQTRKLLHKLQDQTNVIRNTQTERIQKYEPGATVFGIPNPFAKKNR